MDAENLQKLAGLKKQMAKANPQPKPKPISKKARKKREVAAQPAMKKPKRTDWIKSRCTVCRTEFAYLPEWRPTPVLCSGCRNERKRAPKGRRGSSRNERQSIFTNTFTSTSVVPGGAPGGGRRR